MKKNTLILIVILIAALFAISQYISSKQKTSTKDSEKISVMATFYPLAHFAEQVGQEKITVTNLTPAGVEPHDFEPSPQDLVALYNSDLLLYNGAGFEPWLDSMIDEIEENTNVVNTSVGVATLPGSEDDHADEDEEGEDDHDELLFDPHVWLDPNLAIHQVTTIKDGLIAIDPQNSKFYEQNANDYIAQLTTLDSEFRSGLAQCKNNTIVSSHNAFQYLADQYNFEILSISGLSPDEEPSARQLAQVADFVKANGVTFIFFETLVSPKLAQTIAYETGAQTAVLNPLEGLTIEEVDAGENYLTIQRANLNALQTALECN